MRNPLNRCKAFLVLEPYKGTFSRGSRCGSHAFACDNSVSMGRTRFGRPMWDQGEAACQLPLSLGSCRLVPISPPVSGISSSRNPCPCG